MAAEIRLKIRFLPDGLNQEFECSILTREWSIELCEKKARLVGHILDRTY